LVGRPNTVERARDRAGSSFIAEKTSTNVGGMLYYGLRGAGCSGNNLFERNFSGMKRIVALLTSLAILAPGAAVASANSSQSAYGNQGVKNVENTATSPAGGSVSPTSAARAESSTGSLPFTGLDLGALAAGGVVLLGAGLVVRRLSAENNA
jgi:hypothetical protein